MCHRKVLLVALLAVVLLVSFMDVRAGAERDRRRKPRRTVADGIALSMEITGDTSERQASLPNLMKQLALSMEITGDTSERQASLSNPMKQLALSMEITGDTSERQASLPNLMKQLALSMEITGDTSERQASLNNLKYLHAGWDIKLNWHG